MKYNSPLMKFLETIANMLIVSFFWILCSIPIFTIIPATAALYHTTNRVIFNGRGNGVIKDFFKAFKINFMLGFKANLICVAAIFFIVVGLNTGFQIYTLNTVGLLYLILGFLITFVFGISIVFLPVVISRFHLRVVDAFKLSVFFAFQNVFLSILNLLLLGFFVLTVKMIPLTIIIIPALYIDLIRSNTEKKMKEFIINNNLQENVMEEKTEENVCESVSSSTIDEVLSKSRRKR